MIVTKLKDKRTRELQRKLKIGSDIEIATQVLADLRAEYGEIVFADGDFYWWEGTHWQAVHNETLQLAVHRYDGATYPTARGNSVVRLNRARVDSVLNQAAPIVAQRDFFAQSPMGINCASGFIKFGDDGDPSLVPHDPEYRCRHVLPGHWRPGTDPQPPPDSVLYKLLDGVFRDDDADEKRALLAEIAGAAATGYATKLRSPKAAILKGERAENGKSEVLNVLRSVLPPCVVASVTATQMGDEKYLVKLRGKLLNAADELSNTAIASERFKAVVTGEPISARDVYHSSVDFRAVAQHVYATNTLPTFAGGIDRGVKRRVVLIPFNRVIPLAEQIRNIGLLIAEEEPDLLLAWAVGGAQRLIHQRDFTVPPSSEKALQQWLYTADPVLAWTLARVRSLPDYLSVDDRTTWKKSGDAHAHFTEWALANGFRKDTLPAVNGFVQRLEAHVPDARVKHTKTGNWITGISIRVTEDFPDDEEC